MVKPIAFRPTEKADNNLEAFMNREKRFKTTTEALNYILENLESLQSEQPFSLTSPKEPTGEVPYRSLCRECYYSFTPDDFFDNPKYDEQLFYTGEVPPKRSIPRSATSFQK